MACTYVGSADRSQFRKNKLMAQSSHIFSNQLTQNHPSLLFSIKMADDNWKKRVGVNINYNSDSDGESTTTIPEEKDGDASQELDDNTRRFRNHSTESSFDAILHEYGHYGSTPPRTRYSRHQRDWKRREKGIERKENQGPNVIARRNTFDAMYYENGDIPESDGEETQESDKRVCKRSMKLLRCSERDFKLDISHPSEVHSFSVDSGVDRVDRAESVPIGIQPEMKIESSNRFLSLTSTLVACQNVKKSKGTIKNSRQELYLELLPLSGPDKNLDKLATRQLSNEEYRWQNDMKDLIWLELQAWQASRSLHDQDCYLCTAREEVEKLLHEIMEYHFQYDYSSNLDHSGGCEIGMCLSMYCESCIGRQNTAIRDIEKLCNRLEQAESLFPSSKAFAASYPLYKDEKFTARVKSMCLWLNMTKQHRLKMLILGKLLISRCQPLSDPWPGSRSSDGDSGRGSNGTNTEGEQESPPVEETPRKRLEWKPSVRFDTEYTGSSPSDSTGSNNSTSIYEMPDVVDYSSCLAAISQKICPHKKDKDAPQVYRLFIEEVLKTKGLRKSVRFLERLHRYTLVRSCITLEKTCEIPSSDSEKKLECAHEDELRRHGFWSQELQEIGLPSYHSSFLFLARIPIRLINEYLDMRLEQQPEKPSDLCLRQLMRELKEGLRLAVMFRERFEILILHAFRDMKLDHDLYEDVHDLDKSSQSVFRIYLDYLQRWCQLVEQESYQKSLLDEEWMFAKQVACQIPEGVCMVAGRFCSISKTMLTNLGNSLSSQIEFLTKPFCDSRDDLKDQVTKQSILTLCRELQCVFNDMRERFLKAFNFAKTLKKDVETIGSQQLTCLGSLKYEAFKLCKTIKIAMMSVENAFSITENSLDIDAMENEAVQATIRETLHQGYKFGFEYHREVCKNVTGDLKPCVTRGMCNYAQMWMNFVKQRCERGRGMKPKWATQGLEFLLIVCDTENTQYLTQDEFEELRIQVQSCTQFIIGKDQDPVRDVRLTDTPSRANSPTSWPRFRLPRSPLDTNVRLQTPSRKSSINTPSDGSVDSPSLQERKNALLYVSPKSRMERVRTAVDNLERNIDHKLRTQNLIGYVTAVHKEDRVHIRLRQVTFSWQRGIKIGQGSFGKVYTAVNNITGELMAMKEVQLQPNDHRTIKKIAQELAIFEGIQHKHLVKYYGVEIHRDEMLIFMEFCEEGTLETLVAATNNGLPEPLIRRFTLQLIQAVHTLHSHGIVHRDIKSANIFLTDEGNCLKLGDFGSAVKIKAHTTMPGEVQGFVGTQAYMAPEVFTKMHTEGHGRAVDIWSVGCVVVEMASGKRPWAELDSNYQVMFKVGMGETPAIPSSLSDLGYDFVDSCLQHDPQQRANAADLLHHPFLKVDGEEPLLSLLPSIIDDYGHFGGARC